MPPSPPTASEWPIYFSATASINAPREKVWDTLLDFSSYHSWNPHIRFASPLDSNKKPLAPSVPLSEGHYLFLKTHIPASMDDSIKTTDMTEHIKYVDRERFMLAWGSEGSGVMFGAEQWHMLTEENGQTKYEAVAVMKGLVAHGVKRVMKQTARDLESSIQDMATSLQHVCE